MLWLVKPELNFKTVRKLVSSTDSVIAGTCSPATAGVLLLQAGEHYPVGTPLGLVGNSGTTLVPHCHVTWGFTDCNQRLNTPAISRLPLLLLLLLLLILLLLILLLLLIILLHPEAQVLVPTHRVVCSPAQDTDGLPYRWQHTNTLTNKQQHNQ